MVYCVHAGQMTGHHERETTSMEHEQVIAALKAIIEWYDNDTGDLGQLIDTARRAIENA